MKTGTGKVIPGHSHISTDTRAQVVMIHIETILGRDIGITDTIPEVAHDAQVPHTGVIAIDPAMTHHTEHTADHLCTEAHHHTTPESKATHIHVHPTNPEDEIYIGHTCTPVDHDTNYTTKRTPE